MAARKTSFFRLNFTFLPNFAFPNDKNRPEQESLICRIHVKVCLLSEATLNGRIETINISPQN